MINSMPTLKQSFWTLSKEYFLLTFGLFLYVLGWTLFLVPNNLVGGGVTGISSIVQYATGLKMGYTYFVLNGVLLLMAFLVMGSGCGIKNIYAIVVAAVLMNVMQGLIPQEIVDALAIQNGKLMSTIMGAILVGIGIGMSISAGGSTGGTDIVALIANKFYNISPGKMILEMDFVIILSSLLVPSYTADGSLVGWADKFTTVIYGLILVTINGHVIDLYLSGSKQSVQLFILSSEYEKIADAITHELHRGVTVIPGKGWYTKKDSQVLMVITRKTDLSLLLKYIKSLDSHAFLSVSSVNGVYGNGFDQLKGQASATKENTVK